MKPALSLLACLSLAACSVASDSSADADGQADSTMVVPSEARVPSESGPRVVFLGTSLTAGLGLEGSERGYVEVLDALADSAGLPMEAVNAGVSGETSAGGLRRLDWVLRDPLDILFLELGANDGLRGQSPDAMRDNLVEIIEQTRTRHPGTRVVLAGMEAPPNLGPIYTTAFRQVFQDITESHDVTFVPFLLDGVAGVPELNQDDRIHPTEEGHEVVARTVWPYLAGVLRDLEAPS